MLRLLVNDLNRNIFLWEKFLHCTYLLLPPAVIEYVLTNNKNKYEIIRI